MSVSFVINAAPLIEDALNKKTGKRQRAYSFSFLDELSKTAMESIQNGDDLIQTQVKVSKVFKAYKSEIKDALKERIAKNGNVKWDDIKHDQSLNGTYNETIERSFNNTKRVLRNKIIAEQVGYKKAFKYYNKEQLGRLKQMGITGNNDKEILENIGRRFANSLVDGLSGTMRSSEKRVVNTEIQEIKYKKFRKEAIANGKAVRRVATSGNPCQICAPIDGSVYSNIKDAPPVPSHPGCMCKFEYVN